MEILGIGGAEFIAIFIIMLVVAGPKRMIQWAYVMGKYTAKIRAMWAESMTYLQKEFDAAGLDVILVGDSLGMVMQGKGSTLPVTVEDIVYHTACVARGLRTALLIADMPFQSFATPERALDAATLLVAEGGASMVKLEGAGFVLDSISFLSERDIPVCAHLGLTPQSVMKLGGYRVQGRDSDAAKKCLPMQ